MRRHMRLLSLIMLAVWMLNGVAFAGIIGSTQVKIAKEFVDANGANTAGVNLSTVLGAANMYTPANIPLGTANNFLVSFQLATGKFLIGTALNTANLQLCDAVNNVLVGTYQTGSGSNTLVFTAANVTTSTITNGANYDIAFNNGTNDCLGVLGSNADGSDSINITGYAANTASDALTAKLGSATTQAVFDSAGPTTVVSSVQLVNASITTKLGSNVTIDFATNFKSLFNGVGDVSSDDLEITVTGTNGITQGVNTSGNDTMDVMLTVSDMSGITAAGTNATWTTASNFVGTNDCTVNVTAKTIRCTVVTGNGLVSGGNDILQINVNTDGTNVIGEKTFTASANFNFAAADMMKNDMGILTNAPAGSWVDRGTSLYIPLIRTNAAQGRETFIKLQSKDAVPDSVRMQVLCSDGSVQTINLGTITPGTPFATSGALIIAALPATCTVDAQGGFAGVINITASAGNLFGYANIVDNTGFKRIPLLHSSGVEQGAQ